MRGKKREERDGMGARERSKGWMERENKTRADYLSLHLPRSPSRDGFAP